MSLLPEKVLEETAKYAQTTEAMLNSSMLPEVTEEAIAEKQFIIKEKAKLTWDGKQLLVRIPSEIAKEWCITKENRMQFT